jgi:hypothetical protein
MNIYEKFLWVPATKLKQLAEEDNPWCFYLETQVYLEGEAMSGIVRPSHEMTRKLPPFKPLHVISATQPVSTPDPEECTARLAILVNELKTAGIKSIRAVGSSFGGDHREESRAVFGLTDSCARNLGIRFGQVAIFSWKGPHWSLLACADDKRVDRPWQWQQMSNGNST